jgi:hypothetical protein
MAAIRAVSKAIDTLRLRIDQNHDIFSGNGILLLE